MSEYISRDWLLRHTHTGMDTIQMMQTMMDAPAADVVPWEFLERYADYFCAVVSMPDFIREARSFYEASCRAMEGGVIV